MIIPAVHDRLAGIQIGDIAEELHVRGVGAYYKFCEHLLSLQEMDMSCKAYGSGSGNMG